MAQAIETMMLQPGGRIAYADGFKKLQTALQWPNVARPLIDFCMSTVKAPDMGLYRTEAERIEQAKDAFLEHVVKDKDAFLAQVVTDKDAFLSQVISEKDEFLEKVVREKDAYFEQAIQAKDNRIREQDAEIEHYRNILPLRVYRGLKRLAGKP